MDSISGIFFTINIINICITFFVIILGNQLSMIIKNLLPMATYFFKIQARNLKGYGPLSPVVTYVSENNNYMFGIESSKSDLIKNLKNNEAFFVQFGHLLT